MGKQNVAHPHTGVLISLKNEGNSDACCSLGEPCKHCTEQKTSNTKGRGIIPGRGGGAQSRQAARSTELMSAGNNELLCRGKNFEFGKMKKFQERIAVMVVPQWESTQCHSEPLKMANFILYIFYPNLFFFFLTKGPIWQWGVETLMETLRKVSTRTSLGGSCVMSGKMTCEASTPRTNGSDRVSSWVFWSQPRALQSETEVEEWLRMTRTGWVFSPALPCPPSEGPWQIRG